MRAIELQEDFVRLIARDAPINWERLNVHYENYLTDEGEPFEISQSRVRLNSEFEHLELSLDAIDLLISIRDEMASSVSSPWTWVEVNVESSGRYNFDFKYGVPPLTAESLGRRAK